MKVSVITACYDSVRTIAGSLDSVANQTYANIEHIVVDGGSLDGTLEVIAANSQRVAKLLRGPDRGIYDALNKGLGASTGDVVAFLHSDDVYASREVIEKVVSRMSAEHLQALYGDV